MPDIQNSIKSASGLDAAMQDLLRQLIDKIVGAPSNGKGGEPLRKVCYAILPIGEPIDPKDFSFPWNPAGGDSAEDVQDDGTMGTAAVAARPAKPPPGAADAPPAAPVPDEKLQHALASAMNTSIKFDRMMWVTDDGTYEPRDSTVSSAYEAIITKAQGIPAPPLRADIQAQLDEARQVLNVFDKDGNQMGPSKAYKNYKRLMQAYADAEAAFANAEAAAMTDATLGQVWPVTSKSLRAGVDNAYDDWRSADAEKIENALETIQSTGGSIGNHFLAQARKMYSAWNLGLAGSVEADIPYTQVMPGSWWDPNDDENGFAKIKATDKAVQHYGKSHSGRAASNFFQGQGSSTSESASVSFGIVSAGADASQSDSSHQSGSQESRGKTSNFGDSISNVTIKLEYGLCQLDRPWLSQELFVIDGWYLPGEKDRVVSDGTIGGQKGKDDKHLLPMIPTQFLVVRNVTIEADQWGDAGTQMSKYFKQSSAEDQSSSLSASGHAGFLCFGGSAGHSNDDSSGDQAESSSSDSGFSFSGDEKHGTLSINGCQIVGFVGEIIPPSPLVDDSKKTGRGKQADGQGAQPGGAEPAAAPH